MRGALKESLRNREKSYIVAETDTKKPAHLAFISKANQSQLDGLYLCFSADDGCNIDLQHCSGWSFAPGSLQ